MFTTRNNDLSAILNFLKKNKQWFYEEFGIESIGIFGSFIRNEQKETSDLDIVVKMEKSKKNIHNYLRFKRLLEKELGIKVDVGLENTLKPIVRDCIKKDILYV